MNDMHRLRGIQHIKLRSSYQHVKVLSEAEQMAACYPNGENREHSPLWIAVMPRGFRADGSREVRRGVARCTAEGCSWAEEGDKEEVRRSFNDEHVK